MIKPSAYPLSLRLVLPVLLIYTLVSAIGMYHHELFLDEAHHFLLARDSHDLSQLYQNARYDGHPRFWHALLYLITHYITTDPAGMQVFHLLITTATAFVFLRYAPFSFPVKLLVLSGYYFLFEYNILSRNYSLGLFFLFLCCTLLPQGDKRLPLIGFLLFLMCNTHVFYTFAATSLFVYVFIDQIREKKLLSRPFLIFAGLYFAGCVCALVQARTPVADNVNMTPVRATELFSAEGFSFAAFGLIRGWLPIPRHFDGHFWNSFWLYNSPAGRWIRYPFLVFFLLFPFLFLRKNIKALVFYFGCVALLLLFFDVTRMTASRYFGMVFVFFLVAVWLGTDPSQKGGGSAGGPALSAAPAFMRNCFYLILVIQSVVGLFAWIQDLRLPFSESKNAVAFLKKKGLVDQPLIVDGYNSGPMLCAYLQKDVFYLATGQEGSFCTWKKEYFPTPRPSIGQVIAQYHGTPLPEKFILISNRNLDTCLNHTGDKPFRLTPLAAFANSIIKEDYFIYQFQSDH